MFREDPKEVERTVTLFLHAIERFYGRRSLGNRPITPAQFNLLRYVYLNKDVSIGSIARDLSVSYPAASNAADRLAAKGLVRRSVDQKDRRQVRLAITHQGGRLFEEISQTIGREFLKILRTMHEEDINGLMKGISSFIRAQVMEGELRIDEICMKCGVLHIGDCLVEKIKGESYNSGGREVKLHAGEN